MNGLDMINLDDKILVEAEIIDAWGPFLGSDQAIFTVNQSIILKLKQAHRGTIIYYKLYYTADLRVGNSNYAYSD